MYIAFAKIGKSIKFKRALSPTGGDNEAPAMLRALANNNPNIKFVIVGRSDFSTLTNSERIEQFPYDNVIDVFEGHSGPAPRNLVKDVLKSLGIKISYNIFMIGQIGSVTIPNRIRQVQHPELIASVIEMTKNYSTPILEWWNDECTPTIEIVNDPRYTLGAARDIINDPFVSLSQVNSEYEKSSIISYVDQTRVDRKIKLKYAEMEKIFLYDREAPNKNRNRNVNMMIVLNEGKPSRYPELKKWILDNYTDVDIWGQWDESLVKGDNRFKGTLDIEMLQSKLSDVKFSFIIPIAPGWATSKYIELIHAGVVPFFHPTYAKGISEIEDKIPDFLRPSTPEAMRLTMDKLNSTPGAYERLIDSLQKKLTPDLYDGTRLNDIVMSHIDSNYVRPDLNQYTKKTVDEGFGSFYE